MNSDRCAQTAAALVSPLLLLLALCLSAAFGGDAYAVPSDPATGSVMPAPAVSEPLPTWTATPANPQPTPQPDTLADTGLALPILVGIATLLVCAGVLLLLGGRRAARARRRGDLT